MSGFYWLASYPRSGNTWLRLLIQSCQEGGAQFEINSLSFARMNARSRPDFDEAIGIPASDLTTDESLVWRPAAIRSQLVGVPNPTYAKTHDARIQLPNGENLIPSDVTLGAVYLVRDPRDVALSLSRFLNVELDDAIAVMADESRKMERSERHLFLALPDYWSSWSTNVESWLDGPGIRPHVVRYEEFRADPTAALMGLLPALGLTFPCWVVRKAVETMHLGWLHAQERTHSFKERPPGMSEFFGSGLVGSWREKLNASQIARIESDHGPLMRRLGYLS